MIPFLYTNLSKVTKDLMEHFVKSKGLDEATSVARIDIFKDENLLPTAQV